MLEATTVPSPMPTVQLGNAFRRAEFLKNEIISVAIYLRVSTDEQARDGFGLPAQLKICKPYIERFPNWRLFGVYSDEGVSGTAIERKDLARLLEDAKTHGIKFVVVAYRNRESREEYAGYYLDRQFQEAGITLVSATQDPDPYNVSSVVVGVQRLMDAEDRRKILQQTNDGKQEAAEQGYWTGGSAPFGYTIANQGRKRSWLTVSPKEAAVLRRAYELLVEERLDVAAVVDLLNAERLVTRSGRPWTEANLRKRMRSESVLAGTSTFRNTAPGRPPHAKTKIGPNGNPLLGATVVRTLPPIFTPAQRTALAEALAFTPLAKDSEYLLSGHMIGHCSKHYVGSHGAAQRRYKCRGTAAGCGDVSLRAGLLEAAVWGRLAEFLKDHEKLNDLADEWLQQLPGDRQRHEMHAEALRRETERQKRQLEALTLQLTDPDLDADDKELTSATKHALMLAWKEKKAALGQVTELLENFERTESSVRRTAALVREARLNLDTMTFVEKRALLQLLRIRVTFTGDDVRTNGGARSPLEAWHREEKVLIPADPDDDTWDRVRELLFVRSPGLRRTLMPNERLRTALRAMLFRLRTGCTWAELPMKFPLGEHYNAAAVNSLQARWFSTGLWQEIIGLLGSTGGSTLATPPPIPPLTITGRLNPALLEDVNMDLVHTGQSSWESSTVDKILHFQLEVA